MASKNYNYFVQREGYLSKIENILSENNCIILQGLPGMGKTSLAKTYIDRIKRKFKKIYWINWGSISYEEQLLSVIRDLKTSKDYKENFSLFDGLVKRLKDYPGRILLVIDNLDKIGDIASLIKALKEVPKITVLVTTRENDSDLLSIEIGPFDLDESISLLNQIVPKMDYSTAQLISEHLGNYPFYIVKIANMIASSSTINTTRVKDILLGRSEIEANRFLNQYNKGKNMEKDTKVRGEEAVIERLNDLKKDYPNAYKTLLFLSYINNKTIPVELIYNYFNDEYESDKIIDFLIKNTFISQTEKGQDFITFDIHQVTQSIIRIAITEDERKEIQAKLAQAFVEFYKKYFATLLDGDREDQVFYSHVFKALDYIKTKEDLLPLHIIALKRPLYSQRAPQDANRLFIKAQKAIRDNYSTDPLLYADYLADCIYMKGFIQAENPKKFKEGIEDGYEAIKVYKEINNIEGKFKVYTRIAWINLYQGNTDQSSIFLQKAANLLDIVEENYMKKEYYFVSSWHYLEIGDFERSFEYARKGMEIDAIAKNIYLGLYFRVFIATAHLRVEKIGEALEVIEEGLEKERDLFKGQGTLAKASLLQVKASCLIGKQDYDEAKKIAEESLLIFEENMDGQPYQDTAVALQILGSIYEKIGDFEEAKAYYLKAKKMFESITPHKGVLGFSECLAGLCRVWSHMGDRENFEQEYYTLTKRFDHDHITLRKLKEDLVKMGYQFLLV